jgi:hypothetical protein
LKRNRRIIGQDAMNTLLTSGTSDDLVRMSKAQQLREFSPSLVDIINDLRAEYEPLLNRLGFASPWQWVSGYAAENGLRTPDHSAMESLNDAYWIGKILGHAHEAERFFEILNARGNVPMMQNYFIKALIELGEAKATYQLRSAHYQDVDQRSRAKAALQKATPEWNAERKAEAAEWKRRAREIAADILSRRPNLASVRSLAPHVQKQLAAEGHELQERTVRGALKGIIKPPS